MPQIQIRHALHQNRLAMVGPVDPDGQMESEDDESHDLQVAKPKWKWNDKMEWTLIKRWVTGQKAEMELEDIEEDIDRELFELARE